MNKNGVLQQLLKDAKLYPHVEGHAYRLEFIECVIKRYNEGDLVFNELVDRQLSCFCEGYVDPRTFYDVCNNPRHRVRNMLIVWTIDHPEAK